MKKITSILVLMIFTGFLIVNANVEPVQAMNTMIANNRILLAVNGDQCGTMVQDGKFVQRQQESADNMTVRSFIANAFTFGDKNGTDNASYSIEKFEADVYISSTTTQSNESINYLSLIDGSTYSYDSSADVHDSNHLQHQLAILNVKVAPKIPNNSGIYNDVYDSAVNNTCNPKQVVNLRGSVLKTIIDINNDINVAKDISNTLFEGTTYNTFSIADVCNNDDTTQQDSRVIVANNGSQGNQSNTTSNFVVIA